MDEVKNTSITCSDRSQGCHSYCNYPFWGFQQLSVISQEHNQLDRVFNK